MSNRRPPPGIACRSVPSTNTFGPPKTGRVLIRNQGDHGSEFEFRPLSTTDAEYRGRVSGVRMLVVYGLPVGLLCGGALIEWIVIGATFTLYYSVGATLTLLTGLKWPVMMRS